MSKKEGYSVKLEIMDTVMRLMSEKNYMDISVTDIVKKAGVARASFYRNFDSISDVIDAIADKISNELVEDVMPVLYSTDERKWREFLFNHFYRFIKIQKDAGNLRVENNSVLFSRIDNRLDKKDPHLQNGDIRSKYLAAAKMGLINNVTKRWMDSGAKESPEEMIDYIMSYITTF